MIDICTINKKQKKKLVNFLKLNHDFKLSDYQYNFLFKNHWTKKGELGNIIQRKKKIIGFYGFLKADNYFYFNSKTKITNVHTWVVEKKYRYLSLNLINELNKIDGILVSQSTLISLKDIFLKLGWSVLEEYFYLIPTSISKLKDINYNSDYPINIQNKNVVLDHINDGAKYINIQINKKNLFIIFNLRKKIGINIAEIIHFSCYKDFNKNFKIIRGIFFQKFRVILIKVDYRFLNKFNKNNYKLLKFKYKKHLKIYKINRLDTKIKKNLITNLYSEFQLIK